MNKKLKIYSILFVVALVALTVNNNFFFGSEMWITTSDEKMEIVENPNEIVTRDTLESGAVITTTTKAKSTISYEVYVQPKNTKKCLRSTAGDQVYTINMQKVRLEKPATRDNLLNFAPVFAVSSAIVTLIVVIWILCMVYKLIRRIHQGEVFVAQVAKYLETTGILLTALYLFQWITTYALTQYISKNIMLADYYVVYKNECNSMYIFTGLALMIISQIILMGKELREEQELTI